MTANLYLGTSGFAYKEWKGPFYPEGTTDKKMLAYYSTVLRSVEINYTFRRLPSETTLKSWLEQSSDGFRFTLKASQRITHFKRLVDVADDVAEFVRRARELGDRLGTILFQLPPNLAYERALLESFIAILPPVARYAMEFRNATWDSEEVRTILRDSSVALCGAETEEKGIDEVPVTASFAYLRLRKEEYTHDELAAWSKRLSELLETDIDVYCYFKHEGGGVGPAYALEVKEAVGA